MTLIFFSVLNFAQAEQTAVFVGVNDPQYITDSYSERKLGFSVKGYSLRPKKNRLSLMNIKVITIKYYFFTDQTAITTLSI
ncbi:MAG: hypothetical protein KBH06_05305 [Spirochaetes bacterium]|nr:hypothetical protein [Spirochaetota bacterium]MBP9022602.1 hypothetical protein [Spirochaetota bacterium]